MQDEEALRLEDLLSDLKAKLADTQASQPIFIDDMKRESKEADEKKGRDPQVTREVG